MITPRLLSKELLPPGICLTPRVPVFLLDGLRLIIYNVDFDGNSKLHLIGHCDFFQLLPLFIMIFPGMAARVLFTDEVMITNNIICIDIIIIIVVAYADSDVSPFSSSSSSSLT